MRIEPTTSTASSQPAVGDSWLACRSDSSAASLATYPASGGSPIIEATASPATTERNGMVRRSPESWWMSRVPAAASTIPTTRNRVALNIAWPPSMAIPASATPRSGWPTSMMSSPSWETVP